MSGKYDVYFKHRDPASKGRFFQFKQIQESKMKDYVMKLIDVGPICDIIKRYLPEEKRIE